MEQWREIQGYPKYLVSNFGRVMGAKGYILNACDDHKGYLIVSLHKEGKQKCWRVHKLVGEAFIPNPHNLPELDHIDRNRLNNNISNLRWVDKTTNQQNRNKKNNASSQYYGVQYRAKGKPWECAINHKRKYYYIGTFDTEHEAARAYDVKARELYGETARLNFP